MKRFGYKYSVVVASLCLFLCSSCEDFLDRQEDEKLTFDKIWENRNTTKQYWLNAMSFLPDEEMKSDVCIGASDEVVMGLYDAHRLINYGTWNPNNLPKERMTFLYKGIRECNIFLQNADRCSDPLLDKNELAKWKVQTRFARAYYYFLMMKDFGPVFLLGDELLDFSASTEELYRPRNTWEQCVDYVVSEMEACIADPAMLKQTELPNNEWGVATEGTCYAVISRLTLYSARDLFNGNQLYRNMINPECPEFPEQSGQPLFPQTYDPKKWLVAAQAAHKVFGDGSYELYRAGNGNPYEDYYGVSNVNWNSELIWTDRYENRYEWAIITCPTCVGSGWGANGPTQQMVDAFAMKGGRYPILGYESDGTPVTDPKSGYKVNEEFVKTDWEYPVEGWTLSENYTIHAPNMYKDREPRFYISVFWGDNYWHHGTSKTKISFAKGGNANMAHDFPPSGYLINRFYDHLQNSAAGNWGNITYPVFRLGEIYLNFIESVLECKKRNVALPAGYYEEAMEKWDDLRDRAGVPPILEVYPGASVDELIELCRKERRVELAYEKHRYYDTRTWMIAEQTDAGPMYGMDTACPLDPGMKPTETPNVFWKRTVFETRVFYDNFYLYPFPQRELDRNKLLVQNYGW